VKCRSINDFILSVVLDRHYPSKTLSGKYRVEIIFIKPLAMMYEIYTHVNVFVHSCVWSQEVNTRSVSQFLVTFLSESGSLTYLEPTGSARLTGQQNLQILQSPSSCLSVAGGHSCILCYTGIGDRAWVLVFCTENTFFFTQFIGTYSEVLDERAERLC